MASAMSMTWLACLVMLWPASCVADQSCSADDDGLVLMTKPHSSLLQLSQQRRRRKKEEEKEVEKEKEIGLHAQEPSKEKKKDEKEKEKKEKEEKKEIGLHAQEPSKEKKKDEKEKEKKEKEEKKEKKKETTLAKSHAPAPPPPPYSNITTAAPIEVKHPDQDRDDLSASENETREDAAQDCLLSEWSEWSECLFENGDGMKMAHRKRTREKLQPKVGNGTACNTTSEEVGCTYEGDEFEDEKEKEDIQYTTESARAADDDGVLDELRTGRRRRDWSKS
eukprot:gnl/TRDRNA2_/TRDRNA2_38396_c0_seq1.p1 gnl/TRDRNA2_/TRDRNA2_38396_c0~~gnl/TRDRNA2_/TRDRNA2_38396_c0_seq1.p1  ORF type:complete len:279 (-),score=110.90 gnl/TRDRNA2_/TRDRNA2_38396_c0_seq1:75-911(-)